jgi:hypothetical protein
VRNLSQYVRNRIKKHIDFVAERIQSKGSLKYTNKFYGFPVITNQEKELILNDLTEIKNLDKDTMEVSYSEEPQAKNFGEQLRRCKGTKHLC